MSQLEVDKIIPQSGTTLTIGDSGDTVNFADGTNLSIDTNTLYIDSTNNRVGIANSSPSVALDVTGAAKVSGDLTVDTNTLYVDSTNNRVGIGTSSPSATRLQVTTGSSGVTPHASADDLFIENSSGNSAGLTIASGASDSGRLAFADTGSSLIGLLAYDHSSNSMQFTTNGSERMRIDSSGNVLVGVTSTSIPGIGNTTLGASLRNNGGGSIAVSRGGDNAGYFNRNTSDGSIVSFRKDGTEVGSIGAIGGDLAIGTGDAGLRFYNSGDSIFPINTSSSYGVNDNATDLGYSGGRFKDLYLGGGLYVGGTGTANKLDDYEEGTWTPTFINFSGSGGESQPSVAEGHYTKIGNLVYIGVYLEIPANGDSSALVVSNIPFTSKNTLNNIFGGSVTRTDAVISNGVGSFIPDNANNFYVSETNAGNLVDYSVFSGKYLSMVATYLTDA